MFVGMVWALAFEVANLGPRLCVAVLYFHTVRRRQKISQTLVKPAMYLWAFPIDLSLLPLWPLIQQTFALIRMRYWIWDLDPSRSTSRAFALHVRKDP